jgi:hypothetical protein
VFSNLTGVGRATLSAKGSERNCVYILRKKRVFYLASKASSEGYEKDMTKVYVNVVIPIVQ